MTDNLMLRRVEPSDCRVLWEWANDPETRSASLDPRPIPWEQHVAWFNARLHDNNSVMYIATVANTAIGVIRFTVDEDSAVVSITVGRRFRGQGYGRVMLRKAVDLVIREKRVSFIDALVKEWNLRSIRVFLSSGFVLVEKRRLGDEVLLLFRKRVDSKNELEGGCAEGGQMAK